MKAAPSQAVVHDGGVAAWHQSPIILGAYEAANSTRSPVKVVICYTGDDQRTLPGILKDSGLVSKKSIVVIDARSDNKSSGSKE